MRHHLYSKHPRVVGDTSVRDLLKRISNELAIGFIDATKILAEHKDEQIFWRYDTHPTARGYELVARVVAEKMRRVLIRSRSD